MQRIFRDKSKSYKNLTTNKRARNLHQRFENINQRFEFEWWEGLSHQVIWEIKIIANSQLINYIYKQWDCEVDTQLLKRVS